LKKFQQNPPPPHERRKNENLFFTSPLYYYVTNLIQITFSISRYHPAQSRDVGALTRLYQTGPCNAQFYCIPILFNSLSLSLSLYVIQDDDDYLDMYTRLLLFKRERKNKICF
jgi:hypothetical protein